MGERVAKETSEQIAAGYWKKINERLPSHLTDQQKIWIKNYLQAQVAISQKDPTEAYKIFTRLDNEEGPPFLKKGIPNTLTPWKWLLEAQPTETWPGFFLGKKIFSFSSSLHT